MDLTGPLAAYGAKVNAGYQFAVDYVNKNGGVNGRRLVLGTVQDSQGTPTGAQTAYRAAIASQPFAMVGFTASAAMVGVKSLLGQSNIPQFSTSGVPDAYFSEPWFYDFSLSSAFNSSILLAGAKVALGGSLQGKKLAMVYNAQSPAYTQDFQAIKAAAAKDGFTLDPIITTGNTTPSFDAQAAQIVAAHPDATIALFTGNASHTTGVKALLAAGYKGKIVLGDPGSSNTLLQAYGSGQVFGLRSETVPDPGTQLGQAARAAGVPEADLGDNFFPWGVATIFGLAAALDKCGASCTQSSLLSTTATLGQVTLPLDVLPGPVNFGRHDVYQYGQAWTWDPQKNTPVSVGSAFNVYGS